MRTKAIFAAMVLALAPLPIVAQDFNAGLAAYGRSDYDTALREWKPLAEQGNVMAQKFVALLYQFGDGVTEDYAEAVRWYRAAAEQGDVGAQLTLGRMFAEGQELDVAASLLQEKRVVRGIEQDYTEALRWFHAAAEQGDDGNAKVGHGSGVIISLRAT